MEDREVIQAFVGGGARRAFGPTLHIEGDVLFFDGWWQAALRFGPTAFAIRGEEPPDATDVGEQVAEALQATGLQPLGTDFPLIGAFTYAEIALGPVAWVLWAPDMASGQAALEARVGKESFLGNEMSPNPTDPDFTAEVGGARRIAGLPAAIILTVGVDPSQAEVLEGALPECRFVTKPLEGINPDVCGALIPNLIMVDATAPTGRELIMELKAAACSRFVPVMAVTAEGPPPGADAAVDPQTPAVAWVERIRTLLP
ncbi:MAG: hypothetical protein M3179_07660 [Actinomycetota bacterium]|nr:hypothetical protein [Actinomycetota bacterium]